LHEGCHPILVDVRLVTGHDSSSLQRYGFD
jgi:hypothetical protein